MNNAPPLIAFAILLFNALLSYTLFMTWKDAPIEKLTWIAFLIWTFPIFAYWFKFKDLNTTQSKGNTILLGLSLLFAFFSIIGSINALAYIGLALALTALVPWSWSHLPWFLTSASWMPALGWFYTHLFPSLTPFWLWGGRIAVALAGTLGMLYAFKSKKETRHG